MEVSPTDYDNKLLNFNNVDKEVADSSGGKKIGLAIQGVNLAVDMLSDVSNSIVIQVSSKRSPLSASVHIKSDGIGSAGKLAIQSMVIPNIVK